jgi:hypothetical protein
VVIEELHTSSASLAMEAIIIYLEIWNTDVSFASVAEIGQITMVEFFPKLTTSHTLARLQPNGAVEPHPLERCSSTGTTTIPSLRS